MLRLSRRIGRVLFGKSQRSISFSSRGRPIDQEDLYRYTNGRFLVDDEFQRRKRYVKFDIARLCDVVSSVGRSTSPVVTVEKLEGGFSKALLMTREDGLELVAKIPCRNAGPAFYTTASEVAVLNYVREYTSVPVPKVLAWSPDSSNPVGVEYIILEKAPGIQLFKVWGEVEGPQRFSLIKQLVEIERQFSSIQFPAYGHLYLTESTGDPETREHLEGTIDPTGSYCVGRSCDRSWEIDSPECQSYVGPWRNLAGYGNAIVARELHRLNHGLPTCKPGYPMTEKKETIKVLEDAKKVMNLLSSNPVVDKLGVPFLWHTDLHMGNIFVSEKDYSDILSLIDWQSIGISPAFLQVRWPICLEPPDDYIPGLVAPKLPDNFNDMDSVEKSIAHHKLTQASRTKVYEGSTYTSNRLAHDARNLPAVFKEIFIRCDEAFEEGVVPLRECLVEMSQTWDEIGFKTKCPLHFPPEVIEKHKKEFQNTDEEGWISPELDFNEKIEQNKTLFNVCLEQEEGNCAEEELKMIWPFSQALDSQNQRA